jgi:hypothetical protein
MINPARANLIEHLSAVAALISGMHSPSGVAGANL